MPQAKQKLHRLSIGVVCLISALMIGVVAVSAQAPPTSLPLGQPLPGSITPPETQVIYQFEVTSPTNVEIQVLSITPGFFPSVQVIDSLGVALFNFPNNGTQTTLKGTASMSAGAPYRIVVQSFGSVAGQFVISVNTSTVPVVPAQPLPLGQMVNDLVSLQPTSLSYSINDPNFGMLLLTVNSTDMLGAADTPSIILRDAQTGETLAVISGRLMGNRFRIPTPGSYTLEVNSNGSGIPQPFTICLESELGATDCGAGTAANVPPPDSIVMPPQPDESFSDATVQPASVYLDPNGSCAVGSKNNVTVNIRSGPSTDFGVVSYLSPTQKATVIGRLPNDSWYQINNNGVSGWVSATVVFEGGRCSGVTIIQFPTSVPTTMSTTMPTSVDQPTAMPTEAPTQDTTAHLNPNGDPEYGNGSLQSGFNPDPYIIGMGGGGSVDASSLGSACSGYMTDRPTYRLNYTAGSAELLRFYYEADDGDPTMVIRAPDGSWRCSDDANGKIYPVIDFNNPAGGTYTIWIGFKRSDFRSSGALKVTESSGNQP